MGFCPKCGTQYEDDSAFCGNCGFNIAQRNMQSASSETAPVTKNEASKSGDASSYPKTTSSGESVKDALKTLAKPNPQAAKVSKSPNSTFPNTASQDLAGGAQSAFGTGAQNGIAGFSILQLGAFICVVIALIFSLLPWIEISSSATDISRITSASTNVLNSIVGNTSSKIGSGDLELDSSYSMFSCFGLGDKLSKYHSAKKTLEDAYADATGTSKVIGLPGGSSGSFSMPFVIDGILWILGVLCLIGGAIYAFATKGSKFKIMGIACLPLVFVSLYCFFTIGGLSSMIEGSTINPIICCIFAAAAAVLAFMSSISKAKAS